MTAVVRETGGRLEIGGLSLVLVSSFVGFFHLVFSRGSPRPGLIVTLAAMILGVQLLAVPYCKRFGAGRRDCVVTGVLFGTIVVLPLLPLLFRGKAFSNGMWGFLSVFMPFMGTAFLAYCVFQTGRATGRYFDGDRDLPELEGIPREVADATLSRLGHPALSIRVAPLGSFNAIVQGLRHSLVVVDRRAAESLPPSQFASLLAHEVGHLELGGVYSQLLFSSCWFAILGPLASSTNSLLLFVPFLLGCLTCSQCFLLHLAELFCDRFAARRTGTEETSAMLRRIHEDQPSFAAAGLLTSLVSSHPPLRVRLAALGCLERGVLVPYALFWALIVLGCVILPLGAHVALAAGMEISSDAVEALWVAPILYLLVLMVVLMLQKRRAGRAYGEALEPRRRGAWARWLFGLSAVAHLGLLAFFAFFDPGDWAGFAALAALAAFLGSALICVFTGAFRPASEQVPRGVRKALANSVGAMNEGRNEEGLVLVEDALGRYPGNPNLTALRGGILANLGRLDEAISILEELRARARYGIADLTLASAELLRGNVERAEELSAGVLAKAPDFESALHLAALAAYEKGMLDRAEERFLRAVRLKGKDALALAGRALVALEKGERVLAKDLLDQAMAAEKPSGFTLLAGALERKAAGDDDGAREELRKALERAQERGIPGWVPYYERLAARKGLFPT